jgi:CRP-like cAMP-binding protein
MVSAETIRRCDDCAMRAHGLLQGVPDEVFKRLSCCMTTYTFPAKHLIFVEGNPCNQLASIRKGMVKLSKHGENGRTLLVGTVGPGFLLGYEALHGKPSQSTAEALTYVELCMTTRQEVVNMMHRFPDVATGLIKLLCHRISELEMKTLQLGTFSARQRLASYLLSTHESDGCFGHQDSVGLGLSRQELADTLGMAKETLIRLLARFAARGLISIEKTAICVREPKALEQMLSGAA